MNHRRTAEGRPAPLSGSLWLHVASDERTKLAHGCLHQIMPLRHFTSLPLRISHVDLQIARPLTLAHGHSGLSGDIQSYWPHGNWMACMFAWPLEGCPHGYHSLRPHGCETRLSQLLTGPYWLFSISRSHKAESHESRCERGAVGSMTAVWPGRFSCANHFRHLPAAVAHKAGRSRVSGLLASTSSTTIVTIIIAAHHAAQVIRPRFARVQRFRHCHTSSRSC